MRKSSHLVFLVTTLLTIWIIASLPFWKGSEYADDIQIVIVDDGSQKDTTPQKADEWAERYPNLIKAVHQENGGHGMGILAGSLREADGAYFKIVDSDDWVDGAALAELLEKLRRFVFLALPG